MADGHPDAVKYAKFVAEPHEEDGHQRQAHRQGKLHC